MITNKVHVKIAGAAGQGIKSSGVIFAKMCTRAGLFAFAYTEYPSLIKGGHNTFQVRVEQEPVLTLIKPINLLLAFDKQSVLLHIHELAKGACLIYDADKVQLSDTELSSIPAIPLHIPALRLTKEHNLSPITVNQVFLGATCALLRLDFSYLDDVVTSEYKTKGSEVINMNLKAARAGYDYVLSQPQNIVFEHQLTPVSGQEPRMFITGNDAIAYGAIKAGCKFYAAYPMTPATSILHTLAAHAKEYDLIVKHAEDEISVANMTIGAGFAGVRAMCGTSGGGFALMNEAVSLAGMTETPLVMVEAMRAGPATGLPTWTEQADLKFVLNTGHGEFPRFVIAPGDPQEAFWMTAHAFNLADQFHNPVIVLTDKFLAESHWTYPFFEGEYSVDRGPWTSDEELQILAEQGIRFKRYNTDTNTGVSSRVVPGQHKNGIFLANSDEHDEYGYSTEDSQARIAMSSKRQRKISAYQKVMPQPKLYGSQEADLTIICWGSTKTPALQALSWLQSEGCKVNILHLAYISPFPSQTVLSQLSKGQLLLNVECNSTAQMASVIREHTSIHITNHLLKNDGRPLYPEEIADAARTLLISKKANQEASQ